MLAELLHRTRTVFSGVYLTECTPIARYSQNKHTKRVHTSFSKRESTMVKVTERIVVNHTWQPHS